MRVTLLKGELLGQTPARSLAVRAQGAALDVFGLKRSHNAVPQGTARAELGDLGDKVHSDGPKEAEARSEVVDVKTRRQAGPQVFEAVGQRVGELDFGRSTRLVHVVARNRNAVELGHPPAGVAKNVGNNAQAGRRRVDVGVAHHELLEDVVLDGALQRLRGHALFFGSHDIKGQDG